jgi:hypothetical protein
MSGWRDRWDDLQRGAALVWIAGTLVVLLTMAAFATDLGWILLWNARLQAAADSAALAGVVNLPGFVAEARSDAMLAAAANDFPVPLRASMTDQVVAENQYRVTLEAEVDTFFLRLIGFDTFRLSQTAQAEYIKPVRLGSPDNTFGSPGTNFWAAINGQYTEIQQGDPYASRCTSLDNEASSPGCNGPENTGYRPGGYYYGVEIAPGSSNLDLRIYDGGHYVSGSPFASGTSNTGDRSWAFDWPAGERGVYLDYKLFEPDSTPTNPTDNASLRCSGGFPVNDDTGNGHFNTYDGPNNCTVNGALTEGIWVLQLPAPLWEGATKFALEATVTGPTQPKVYGILDMSIYVNFFAGSAEPYLAEIRPEHTEKLFEVDIWDLGDNDGPASIRFLDPSGARDCTWTSSNGESGSSADCSIDISDQRFNNEWLWVDIPLDGYSCTLAGDGCWWKVHLETSSGAAHDRTTWAARVSGDPVRLVE